MPLLLLVAFLVVPLLEIYVLVQVGQVIGALPTVLILLLVSILGAWLVRREGTRAWRALRAAVGSGRIPAREVADGALVLVGGTLLLTPGFLTDVVGLFLVVPPSRALTRRLLLSAATRRFARRAGFGGTYAAARRRSRYRSPRTDWSDPPSRPPGGPVIEGETVRPAEPDEPRSGDRR